MQTEPNIKKTDIIGSADVSSGATSTVTKPSTTQVATPEKAEPKKRGRKKGYHHSEATKAAMRKARTGVHPSKETKEKISKAKEGKNHSEAAKLKMSDTRRYNFLRKAIEYTSAGNWTLADLVDFLNEKKTNNDTMSVFAQTIYGLAQAEVDDLIKIPTDTVAQHTVYERLTARIKELYDERIQELSQTEAISA